MTLNTDYIFGVSNSAFGSWADQNTGTLPSVQGNGRRWALGDLNYDVIRGFNDISQIAAGGMTIFLLRQNGTVISSNPNLDFSDWIDIVYITSGDNYIYGLKSDNTILRKSFVYNSVAVDSVLNEDNSIDNISKIYAYALGVLILKIDGSVACILDYDIYGIEAGVSAWEDIIKLASDGAFFVLGLKSDGTCVTAGQDPYGVNYLNVSGWEDIVDIYTTFYSSIGIKSTGTVEFAGMSFNGLDDYLSELDDAKLLAISEATRDDFVYSKSGTLTYLGSSSREPFFTESIAEWPNDISQLVKTKSTLGIAVGLNPLGSVYVCALEPFYSADGEVGDWNDINFIESGADDNITALHFVGLKNDGSVVCYGHNYYDQLSISGESGFTQISVGPLHTLGLKTDGTVVAYGNPAYSNEYDRHLNVSDWSDVICVKAAELISVGLKADGTVLLAGDWWEELDTSSWEDIVQLDAAEGFVLGLKTDGTVLAVGISYTEQYGCLEVSHFTNITQVAAGSKITAVLKRDRTVEAIGYDTYGSLNTTSWEDIVQIAVNDSYTVIGLTVYGTFVTSYDYSHYDYIDHFDPYGEVELSDVTNVSRIVSVSTHTLVYEKLDGTIVVRQKSGPKIININAVKAWSTSTEDFNTTMILGFTPNVASTTVSGNLALVSSNSNDLFKVTNSGIYANDGVNEVSVNHGGFNTDSQAVYLLQLSRSDYKQRVGKYESGSFTWSNWATYSGSFNISDNIDVLVNTESMDLLGMAIYKTILSDDDLLPEFGELDFLVNPITKDLYPENNSNLSPQDYVLLTATYVDYNSDIGSISFYNAADNSLLSTVSGLVSNSKAHYKWTNINKNANYSYYVIPNDGTLSGVNSDTMTFSMMEYTPDKGGMSSNCWATCASGTNWWGQDYTRLRTGSSTTFTCMDDMIGR